MVPVRAEVLVIVREQLDQRPGRRERGFAAGWRRPPPLGAVDSFGDEVPAFARPAFASAIASPDHQAKSRGSAGPCEVKYRRVSSASAAARSAGASGAGGTQLSGRA